MVLGSIEYGAAIGHNESRSPVRAGLAATPNERDWSSAGRPREAAAGRGPAARVLVSACLLGERVRYNGAAAPVASCILERWLAEGRVVSFCPEVAAGLSVPRPAAEISGARVLTYSSTDVTAAFEAGARAALEAAQSAGVRIAVLKDRSPSCGSTVVYDGSFRGVLRPGAGLTAALLRENGIEVFSEQQLEAADACLRALEKT